VRTVIDLGKEIDGLIAAFAANANQATATKIWGLKGALLARYSFIKRQPVQRRPATYWAEMRLYPQYAAKLQPYYDIAAPMADTGGFNVFDAALSAVVNKNTIIAVSAGALAAGLTVGPDASLSQLADGIQQAKAPLSNISQVVDSVDQMKAAAEVKKKEIQATLEQAQVSKMEQAVAEQKKQIIEATAAADAAKAVAMAADKPAQPVSTGAKVGVVVTGAVTGFMVGGPIGAVVGAGAGAILTKDKKG